MVGRPLGGGGRASRPHEDQRVGVFHEVSAERLDQVLWDGIGCGDSGEKTAAAEHGADAFLDAHAPPRYAECGLGRRNVVYGYLPMGDRLIDIRTGQDIEVHAFAAQQKQVLVRTEVERSRCFVSDLDCYDIVKDALSSSWRPEALRRWEARYGRA
jgi:hypothetical protein